MGLRDIIHKFINKRKENSELFRQEQEELQRQKILGERQLSSNERELKGYMREQREKQIKRRLDMVRKQKMDSMWKASLMKNSPKCYIDNSLMKEKKRFLRSGY